MTDVTNNIQTQLLNSIRQLAVDGIGLTNEAVNVLIAPVLSDIVLAAQSGKDYNAELEGQIKLVWAGLKRKATAKARETLLKVIQTGLSFSAVALNGYAARLQPKTEA